jgi:glutamate--cysteine ligase catalytic subunit
MFQPLAERKSQIPKSRFGSVNTYLSIANEDVQQYNDLDVPINEQAYNRLRSAGVDDRLAEHFAHLFIRDPIILFSDNLDQDDSTSILHFENIQTSNWQSMRFKVPPPGTDIGWRVEFRTMECAPTDFENAAFSVFMALLSRAVLKFNVNLYIPMSKVSLNIRGSLPVPPSL